MMIGNLIFGFLLLFAGRSLFWLCVGIVGFLIGMQCAILWGYAQGPAAWVSAFALGCAGAVLAISFEWFMVVLGVGFLGGGYLLMNMFCPAGAGDPYAWPIFVVGGIVGMCLMVIVFDWTLIVVSSMLGATLIVNAFHGPPQSREVLFIVSMMTGIVVQYLKLRAPPHQQRPLRGT